MTRHALIRRLGAVVLAATLVLGVAACDAEDSASTAQLEELSSDELYSAIMAALRDAETFRMETTVTDDEDSSTTMSGDVRLVDDGLEMALTAEGDDAMEMVFIDDTMFMKADSLTSDGMWADVTPAMSMFGDVTKMMDPEVMFAPVEKPLGVELVGTEKIDGVDTHHYRVTVSTAEVLKANGGLAADMSDMYPDEMVIDLWLDAEDLPRKQEQVMEMKALLGEEGETELLTRTVSTYSDHGKDVEIKAPPADEISSEDPFAFLTED